MTNVKMYLNEFMSRSGLATRTKFPNDWHNGLRLYTHNHKTSNSRVGHFSVAKRTCSQLNPPLHPPHTPPFPQKVPLSVLPWYLSSQHAVLGAKVVTIFKQFTAQNCYTSQTSHLGGCFFFLFWAETITR